MHAVLNSFARHRDDDGERSLNVDTCVIPDGGAEAECAESRIDPSGDLGASSRWHVSKTDAATGS